MRVKEIADLAGTTPRAVRHYHRLGLLEVPPTVHGRRHYGVEHLARLLRIRWLADGGLSLSQVADMLTSDAQGSDREAVLRDLRAARGTIEAQRRSLEEQAARIDELIARVESGRPLSPAPAALTRFYDDVEIRVRDMGGDLRSLRTEKQMNLVLASLGMIPDSASAFIEEFDAAEREVCAQQITAFARLTQLDEATGIARAHELAENTMALTMRHKQAAIRALDDLPDGAAGRALWRLTHVLTVAGYPHPAQRAFATRFLELLMTDPDLATTIRRSAGEDPVL
ncbi:MAG: MerR family transcriptional regulator [Actinomyces sp.]|uniref:MerR family transcriptional regulator n=1 Tax=Actinomyces sp. TaxID=29317 RepID=UPI0026DC940C|nr:MerR family transcriptional regulator [Actinomyces sp.]MDO4243709.1 MerR family transcriptional regulator [Actinomyces sp.]